MSPHLDFKVVIITASQFREALPVVEPTGGSVIYCLVSLKIICSKYFDNLNTQLAKDKHKPSLNKIPNNDGFTQATLLRVERGQENQENRENRENHSTLRTAKANNPQMNQLVF